MFGLIFSHLKGKARYWAVFAPLMMMIEVVMDLQMPALMASIVDIGIARSDTAYITAAGLKMILFTLAGLAGGALCSLFAARAAMSMAQNLRGRLFSKIQQFAFADIDRFKTSSLVTRLTNDVQQVQQLFLMMMRIMVRAPFLFLGSIIMSFMLSVQLSVIFIIILPAVVLCIVFLLSRSTKLFTAVQKSMDSVNTVMRENILGIRTIKAYTAENEQKKRFECVNSALTQTNISAQSFTITLLPAVTLIMNLGVVFILWYGGGLVISGGLAAGKIMAFVNYLVQITHTLMMLINLAVHYSRARASSQRISELFDVKTGSDGALHQKDETRSEISSVTGQSGGSCSSPSLGLPILEFRNVSFTYPQSSVPSLSGISFSAYAGQTVGIIGATGSGKSTLAQLIPRLYDVTSGGVFLDGIDIRLLSKEILRKRAGIVMQEVTVFSGTAEENLRFGRDDASEEELDSACRDAQAIDFLKHPQTGYMHEIEQRGKNLSGGQKQRLSIARALLRDPDILILDDSTSAVDLQTEGLMRSAVRRRMKDKTLIIIAQRISVVMSADLIIVLDGGKTAGCGTHRELLESNEIYRSIALSQLGSDALRSECAADYESAAPETGAAHDAADQSATHNAAKSEKDILWQK